MQSYKLVEEYVAEELRARLYPEFNVVADTKIRGISGTTKQVDVLLTKNNYKAVVEVKSGGEFARLRHSLDWLAVAYDAKINDVIFIARARTGEERFFEFYGFKQIPINGLEKIRNYLGRYEVSNRLNKALKEKFKPILGNRRFSFNSVFPNPKTRDLAKRIVKKIGGHVGREVIGISGASHLLNIVIIENEVPVKFYNVSLSKETSIQEARRTLGIYLDTRLQPGLIYNHISNAAKVFCKYYGIEALRYDQI
jgi:hypothetical protein